MELGARVAHAGKCLHTMAFDFTEDWNERFALSQVVLMQALTEDPQLVRSARRSTDFRTMMAAAARYRRSASNQLSTRQWASRLNATKLEQATSRLRAR